MSGFRHPAFLFALVLSVLLAAPSSLVPAAVAAQETTPVASDAGAGPVLLFNAPGMRHDLVETFAAEGALPAIAGVLAEGKSAEGGLAAPFPATTGTNLATLLTGTWPAEHGVVADRFFRTGSPDFADFATWSDPGLIQADTLPQAAERAGKQVVSVGWEGLSALDPPLGGPVVAGPIPYSRSGVVTTIDLADQPADAERLGVGYDHVDLRPAEGWSEAPRSFSPAQETEFTIRSLDPAGPNPDRSFAVYLYDSTDDAATNYDHVLVAPEKDAARSLADLAVGAWAGVPVALTGERDGQAAGFWLKTIDLSPDLSTFRLYYTAVSRVAASWNDCGDRPECTEPGGFEETLNSAVGAPVAVDSAPLEAGLIDEATFVAQGTTGAWQTVDALRFIVADLGVQPDLLLLSTAFPDAVSRQFLGLPATSDAGGAIATPVAEGADADGRVAIDADEVEGFVRDAYMMADQILSAGRDLLGPEATTLMVSPWGLAPSWLAVNAGKVLVDAGITEAEQPENCVPGPVSTPPGTPDPEALPVGPAVKACWSGGTAHVYINLDGREAAGSVAEDAYEPTRDAIVAAFEQLRDPANPDAPVVAAVFRKEDLRDVGGADALHPSRTGDVVAHPGATLPVRRRDRRSRRREGNAGSHRRVSPSRRVSKQRSLPGRWVAYRHGLAAHRPEHRRRADSRLLPRCTRTVERQWQHPFRAPGKRVGSARGDAARHQRFPWTAHAVECRRRRHRGRGRGELLVRRRGRRVPCSLVRPLSRGGAGRNPAGDGRRRGRSDTADLECLRRSAHDRGDERARVRCRFAR